MAKLSGIKQVEVRAKKERNLDTVCYRGQGSLAYLALASRPDVYDAVDNPQGLQRDLSPTHAQKAYEYASRERNRDFPRAFPEVVLNVRDPSSVEIRQVEAVEDEFQILFDLGKIDNRSKVAVSRVDGNHRLYYAAGDERRDPITEPVPFQLHVGLSREQEMNLFVDINANQKGLNSSHLSVLRSNLTEEEVEIRDNLHRWIARQLAERDPASPWHGLIHMGGSKVGARAQGLTRPVNFASLESGVARMLAKSQYIHDFENPRAQYQIVRRYWEAVKQVFAEEWAHPRDYLLVKNLGVMSLSILGGTILDRCLARSRIEISDIAFYLQQAKPRFDWSRTATGPDALSGMTGNRAAIVVAGAMANELRDEENASKAMETLTQKLVAAVP